MPRRPNCRSSRSNSSSWSTVSKAAVRSSRQRADPGRSILLKQSIQLLKHHEDDSTKLRSIDTYQLLWHFSPSVFYAMLVFKWPLVHTSNWSLKKTQRNRLGLWEHEIYKIADIPDAEPTASKHWRKSHQYHFITYLNYYYYYYYYSNKEDNVNEKD